jgi:hypothetical protein
MRLGIIARSDNTGLGNQTRELVKMLNPDKILLIDSNPFNKNKQHPEWYEGYNVYSTKRGMPTTKEIVWFLDNIDVVISCETFYHLDLVDLARKKGTKTILQYNYELFGNLVNPDWPLPDVLLSPSLWNIEIVEERFGSRCEVIHLPPPTDESLFNKAKENNLSKDHNRILHIGGKKAAKDRNGTESIFEMIKHSKEDYELVIKSQTPFDTNCKDSRIKIEIGNPENREDMYDGFDAMILPRRYAGLCLPMNEALLSALPIFMTDISPNNAVLPKEWLAESKKIGSFRTKSMVDIYNVAPDKFANVIDKYIKNNNKKEIKEKALSIGLENFSVNNLKQKYLDIINK